MLRRALKMSRGVVLRSGSCVRLKVLTSLYMVIVVATLKAVADCDWVTTPQLPAVYIHTMLTLAVTLRATTLQQPSLFQPPTGSVLRGEWGCQEKGDIMCEDTTPNHLLKLLLLVIASIDYRLCSYQSSWQ